MARILLLEPYWGGSHRAFIEGWGECSRHDWTLLTLPPYKWKWRMRHSALTLAGQARELYHAGERWDVIFASDMLALAEFCGLAPELATLPRIIYFHENQLMYPSRHSGERDLHFGYTNFLSALAADEVWFNTAWHMEGFLHALEKLLRRMPDYSHIEKLAVLADKSRVMPQGIQPPPPRPPRTPGPLRIVWAARWEHDKNPGDLYGALGLLRERGVPFEVSIIGETFDKRPEVFTLLEQDFGAQIRRWGYQESRDEYYAALLEADYFVSTAEHEFFGVSLMEAASCGTVPLAPERLAYPEVLLGHEEFLYAGTARALAERLATGAAATAEDWERLSHTARTLSSRFLWPELAERFDAAVESICAQ